MNEFHSVVRVDKEGLCLAPERGFVDLLERQESVISDKPGVREIPGSVNIRRFPGDPQLG